MKQWLFTMKSGKQTIVKELGEAHVSARHWSVGETRIIPKSKVTDEHTVIDPDDEFWFLMMTPEGAYITHSRTFEDCKNLYEKSLRDPIVKITEPEDRILLRRQK